MADGTGSPGTGALRLADVQACTRWESAQGRPDIGSSAMLLSGVHCAACSTTVEQMLGSLPGVLEVEASAAAGRVVVRWDARQTHPQAWVDAIKPAGYALAPDHGASARDIRKAESRSSLWRCFVASLCSMQVMMLAAPSYTSAPGELEPQWAGVLNWGQWVLTLPVLLFAARPLFASAWASLVRRQLSMEIPVVLGITMAFVASTAATFDPGGPFGFEVYFDSLTMFVALLLIARRLEMMVRHRAAEQLDLCEEALPQHAWRVDERAEVHEVAVAALQVGDMVRVPVGEVVPADGVLIRGATRVDEALISGEGRTVAKAIGAGADHSLWAGSVNHETPVDIRLTAVGQQTRLSNIAALVQEAQTRRPRAIRAADQWAGPFIVAILLAAAASAIAWWQIDPARALSVAVSVLIVTCPCALSLAVPAAQLAAVQNLARRGVIVRRLEGLDRLAQASLVMFDKTGTLTHAGREQVDLIWLAPGHQAASAWGKAAGLAAHSQHALSRAIAESAGESGAAMTDVRESVGSGLSGVDEAGALWRLGSAQWTSARARDDVRVWLSCDAKPVAGFQIFEVPREDARDAVRSLQASGLHVSLLSGDTQQRAVDLARRVGIADAIGGTNPQQKLAAVEHAQQRGDVVLMVGDGFNDSPALARADVSVAMTRGARATLQQADLLLDVHREDALHGLSKARTISIQARRVAQQNLAWAAVYNATCVPLAAMGWLPPWAAGLGMASSSLLVVLNGARLMGR